MEEVGQLYFNSIPKYVNDTNPQTTNVVELLVEDVGDNVIYETRESRAEEKGGKYNNRNHDEKSINLRFQHSAANLSIGDGEDGDIGNSPATRHTPTLRSRSFFSDNTSSSSSSILPILSSSSAVDGDYCAVNHRVSLKSTFQTGDDNDESFLSGLKFMSADDKKIKSKNRDSFKNSYDDDHLPIHLQDFDRPNGSSLPGDKWEGYTKEVPGKFLSSPTGISPTSPANYRVAKNIVGDDMSHGNNIGDVKGDSGKLFPYKSKNATTATAPTQDINDGIRREFRRKVHTMNRMGSDNEIVSRNDSGGEDDKGSGGNSQYFRPALDSISSKNLKKPSSSVGAIRKKSLIPMNLASVVNGRIHLQRTESLESHTNQSTHGSFQPDEVSQESQKGTLPPGYRSMKHGEGVMGLQLQRIMSSAQNAQLQKEVDALQKQLAQLEELEGSCVLQVGWTG